MNNELTTLNILSLFETDKAQRKSFVDDVVQKIRDGIADPLKVHLQLKSLEDIITQLTSTDEKKNKNFTAAIDYKKMLLDAAEKNGKKFSLFNAEFSIKEVGAVYDFSKTEDVELFELQKQEAELKAKIKLRQDFLKLAPIEGVLVTNENTGETYKIFPPSKSSTTAVSVSLR